MAGSIPSILFWLLAAITLVAPPRWALFFYLLLAQVDLSGTEFASASNLGWNNAFRLVVVPTVLLLRFRSKSSLTSMPKELTRWWILFVSYVAIAAIWSPFPLSAIKMVGYLYCHTVLAILFRRAWIEGWFDVKFLTFNLGGALSIAILQTYILGDLASPEGRLSSFDDPQNFAAFLISIGAIIWFGKESKLMRWLGLAVATIAIALTGSRYVLVGLALLFLLSFLRQWFEHDAMQKFRALSKRLLFGAVACVSLAALLIHFAPDNRITQLASYAATDSSSYEDVRTFAWRVLLYEEATNQLLNRSFAGLLFGSGTSSSGNIKVDVYSTSFSTEDVDANRSMHDEFLRALYEWGIVGLVLFLGFLGSSVAVCWRRAKQTRNAQSLAYIALFPTILLGLGIENILANAGHPAGTGYLLVFTFSTAAPSLAGAPQSNSSVRLDERLRALHGKGKLKNAFS